MKRVQINETELRAMIQILIKEIVEPFQDVRGKDIVKELETLNAELDRLAFSDDAQFDAAFEELAAAHTAISRLLNKVKKPAKPAPQRPVHAESRRRK